MKPKVKIEVSAGGVVYRVLNGIEVVLCRHDTLKGKEVWSLPKGWVERGERVEEAAVREVREETGLDARIVNKIDKISYWFFNPKEHVRVKKTVYFYLMEPISGDTSRHDLEVKEVRWFPIEEAISLCAYPGERSVLKKVKETL